MSTDFIFEAEIVRNDQIIKHCVYDEPGLEVEIISKRLEGYIIGEQLNISGECEIRIRKIPKSPPSSL